MRELIERGHPPRHIPVCGRRSWLWGGGRQRQSRYPSPKRESPPGTRGLPTRLARKTACLGQRIFGGGNKLQIHRLLSAPQAQSEAPTVARTEHTSIWREFSHGCARRRKFLLERRSTYGRGG